MVNGDSVGQRKRGRQAFRYGRPGLLSIYGNRGLLVASPAQRKGSRRKGPGGKRGKVKGWSLASRRRLRYRLLSLREPAGWASVGMTFTVPGPVLPPEQARKLWADFSLLVAHAGLGMSWRMEVQQRGALHWHAIGIGGPGIYRLPSPGGEWHVVDLPTESRTGLPVRDSLAEWLFRRLWFHSLDKLGPVSGSAASGTAVAVPSRRYWPGAAEHAFVADLKHDAWERAFVAYLQEHLTKRKQGQIAEGVGRHWGIVGRKCFVPNDATETFKVGESVFFRVLRMWQRRARVRISDARCVFGSRKARRPRFGEVGSCVRFDNPEHVRRLIEWAHADEKERNKGKAAVGADVQDSQ